MSLQCLIRPNKISVLLCDVLKTEKGLVHLITEGNPLGVNGLIPETHLIAVYARLKS